MTASKKRDAELKDCKSLAFFKSLTLLAGLPVETVTLFTGAAQVKSYKKGTTLYIEAEKAKYFYIVCNGWLQLFHTTQEGEEVSLAVITRAGITGENAIFEDGHYTSSAKVVEDAQILSVPLSLLKEQLRTNNKLAHNMLACMVQYQRLHERQLQQYFLYSAPQRIGCFLLGLLPVLDQKDGVMLNLPYDKALIASTLGMKGATFSRALNILREETGIHITGTHIKIDSIKRLIKFVDGCYSDTHLHKILD